MKKTVLFSAMILLIIAGCNQEPVNPVVGAWDLIYARQVENDSIVATFPGDFQGSQVKMWCNNYWMFAGESTQDSVSNDTAGSDTYTLEGIVYKETIKYHSNKDYIEKTLRMRIVVENDTLIQVWPANELGEIDKGNYNSEKYVKVK